MTFWGICFICRQSTRHRFCDDCSTQMIPSFRLLPHLPNICLGGYLYDYSDAFKTVLRDIKFSANFKLADILKTHHFDQLIPPIFFQTDVQLCVPSHWFRQFWRGTPHIPYLFSRSPLTHPKHSPLYRCKYTQSSIGLSRKQRQKNAHRERFKWRPTPHVKSVTIFDDVCTTGHTVSEIAKCLKRSGIDTIMVVTLAHQSLNDA